MLLDIFSEFPLLFAYKVLTLDIDLFFLTNFHMIMLLPVPLQ